MEEDFSKLPKSNKEAKERGETFYFTGKPCVNGHINKRYARSRGCLTCSYGQQIKHKSKTGDVYWELREINDGRSEEELPSRKIDAVEKGFKFYFTGKPCKYGHVSKRYSSDGACEECSKIKSRSPKAKKYHQKYYRANSDTIKKASKRNRDLNPEKYNGKARDRRKLNPTPSVCRAILHRVLNYTYKIKDNKTCEMLGYDSEDLRLDIENKLLGGMSWDNYGDWHIDHKYPVSRYIEDGVEDPAVINSLDNLIPMWDSHNRQKDRKSLPEYLNIRPDLINLYGRFLGENNGRINQ